MTTRWVQVLPDADAAGRRAADVIAGRLLAAMASKGSFRIAFSGGGTPMPMFEALAARSLPWKGVEIYQVDERVLPAGHASRHLTALEQAFRNTGARIVPMPVESSDLVAAANSYAQALPRTIDLVHLGLGLDGHTASLFADDPVLDIDDHDVAPSGPHEGLRWMTLTYRGLSKAREILWLITGSAWAEPLAQLCADDPSAPAGRVACKRVRIVTDAAAADALRDQSPRGVHLWLRERLVDVN